MNPALALKQLIAGGRPSNLTGTVLTVDGQTLKVRTARGIIDGRSVDATTYRAGDEVLMRDSIVQGKVKPAASVPVYFV
jgi:hypothetical protein